MYDVLEHPKAKSMLREVVVRLFRRCACGAIEVETGLNNKE
jgi:hypothetical protein